MRNHIASRRSALIASVWLIGLLGIVPVKADSSTTTYDPLTSFQRIDNAEKARGWDARWRVESGAITERQRHTLYLEVLNDEPITQVINVDPVTERDLFFEQSSNFWQYGRTDFNGRAKEAAVLKFDLFPARSGRFTLPAVELRLGRDEGAFTVQTPPLAIEVMALPSEARGKIVSSNVTATQKVSQRNITEGGVVTRTITLNVNDLPGHYIAELPYVGQVEGGETRTGNSQTQTYAYRTELTGSRITDIHYRFTADGEYTLPHVQFEWWNTKAQQVETIILDSLLVNVSPAPGLPWKQRLEIGWVNGQQWLKEQHQAFLMWAMIIAVLWRLKPRFLGRYRCLAAWFESATQSDLYHRITTVGWIALGTRARARRALYAWLARQQQYDLTHNSAIRVCIDIDPIGKWRLHRYSLVVVLLSEGKRLWWDRYQLQPLNH